MVKLPEVVNLISGLVMADKKCYLVGGAVRDALLGRDSQDVDVVCSCNARSIAKNVADHLKGSFYVLDAERNAFRVIAKEQAGGRLVIDFSVQRGESIQDDLGLRDFTINAMAIDLTRLDEIIDPLHGARDLQEKWLRPCSRSSFEEDPLRVLRAIRYAVKYDLKIEEQTSRLLKQSVKKMQACSRERIRDELFKILENPRPWTGFQLIEHFGIFDSVHLAGTQDRRKAVSRLRAMDLLLSTLEGTSTQETKESLAMASFLSGFWKNRTAMRDHVRQVNQSERSLGALNKLAALLYDTQEPEFEEILERIVLSTDERDHLNLLHVNQTVFFDLASKGANPDDRAVYQYFGQMGRSGLDLILLSLAEAVNCVAVEFDEGKWLRLLQVGQKLVDTWFERPNVIRPELFLSGRDLMFEFDIPQGPLIGSLLEGLEEEQAAGTIRTRQGAVEWIEGKIQRGFITG